MLGGEVTGEATDFADPYAWNAYGRVPRRGASPSKSARRRRWISAAGDYFAV